VGPGAGLDDVKTKILDRTGTRLRPLGRPFRSQSLSDHHSKMLNFDYPTWQKNTLNGDENMCKPRLL
jgi:hypothetical protein